MRRGIAVTCVAGLFAVAAAQPAGATIVYEHGNEVWAMNDDGSDQRPLATPGPLGMDQLTTPHVAPNGSTVMFDGVTNANYHGCGFPQKFYFGANARGVYRWRDGAITRLTGAPGGKGTCISSFLDDAEATTNGRYMVNRYAVAGSDESQTFGSASQEGGDITHAPSACDDSTFLADPSPNPANPAQFAYVGCSGSGGDEAIAISQGGTHTTPIIDDELQRAVAWRSDGARLAVSEQGTEPGLWTYGPSSPVNPVHVLNGDFRDLSFAGAANDRILFAAGGDIYSVPASCTAATCSFPGSATRLTSSGGNDHPSWTSAGLRPATQGGGGGGGSGTGTGTGTGTGAGGGGGGVDLTTLLQRTRLGRATTRGVPFRIELAAPATLELTFFQVKGRKAKRLGTVRRNGKAGTNTFTITKVGRKKFKKGKYRAQVRAIASGQKGPATTLNFTVKR